MSSKQEGTTVNLSLLEAGSDALRIAEDLSAALGLTLVSGEVKLVSGPIAETTTHGLHAEGAPDEPYCQPCAECGRKGPTEFLAQNRLDVCAVCWRATTRLERIARGWEPDVYALHARGVRLSIEPGGSAVGHRVKGLGRRCWPSMEPENDHRRQPLPVDDPSGDDVCADAPGSDGYFGVRR